MAEKAARFRPIFVKGVKMNVLDLFSGIGGFSLGLERAGMDTVAFCEIAEMIGKEIMRVHNEFSKS